MSPADHKVTKLCRNLMEHIKVFCANSLAAVDET